MKIFNVLGTASILCLFVLSGCGQTKTKEDTTKTKSGTNTNTQNPPTTDDGSGANPLNPATPTTGPDRPFKPVPKPKGNGATAPIKEPSAPKPLPDIPDSEVGIVVPPRAMAEVLGLGSDDQDVKRLLAHGYPSAINEARACRKTGMFSNHARCFIVFKDGHQEWVTEENQDLIAGFIQQLQAASEGKNPRNGAKPTL